jgi:hypothetical protein
VPDRAPSDDVDRLKPPGGQALAGAVSVLAAAAAALVTADEGLSALLTVWPWLGLAAGGAWALYWRPEVVISDGGVRVVNVLRTVDIPWPALRGLDTKWALTLDTVWGRYRAWAAPAPGRAAMRRELREYGSVARSIDRRVPGLPRQAIGRPADLPYTESGAAAIAINARWKRLREAGHLDAAAVERERPQVRWHWELLAGALALVALGTFGLVR